MNHIIRLCPRITFNDVILRQMSRKVDTLFLAIIVFTLVVGGAIGLRLLGNHRSNTATATTEETAQTKIHSAQLSITATDTTNYQGDFQNGDTIFDFLLTLEDAQEDFEFNYEESSAGIYITELNGQEAGEDEVWNLYINSEPSAERADQYLLQAGDKIEFKLEELQ
jgi:hypothetical protein